MMRTLLRFTAILLLSVFPLAAESLPVLTLDDALSSAREKNIELEIAKVEMEGKVRSANAVMTTFLPDISISASASTSASFQSGTAFNGINYDVGADITFPFSGSMITDRRTRDIAKRGASLSFENSLIGLEQDVITGYWGLATADLSIQAAQLSLDSAERQYESTLAMYRNGMVDELSLSEAELSLYDAQLQLKELQDEKDELMTAFRTMTGISGEFSTEPLPEPVLLSLPSPEELFREYSEGSISVQNARNSLESAKNEESTLRLSAYVPSISASLGYSYSGSHDSDWVYGTRDNGISGSVRVSIPISPLIPTSAEDIAIKEAGDNVKVASLTLQNTQNSLLAEIESYAMGISQAEESLKLAERKRAAAERTNALSEEAFSAGLITANDASDTRNRLLNAEMELLSARLSHLLQSYTLASAMNIPLAELQARYARI